MANLASIGSSLGSVQRGLDAITGDISAAPVNGERGRTSIFSSKVISSGGRTIVASVSQKTRQEISVQGDIRDSARSTDIAISGDGFIPVTKAGSSQILLTRSGACEVNEAGDLINENGYVVKGWKLDDLGRKPGEAGNADRRSSSDITSLEDVNVRGLSGRAKATSKISLDLRLNSGEPVIKGAGQIMQFAATDEFNANISESDVIVPNGDNIALGDTITVKVGDLATEYVYGGVTSSLNIAKTAMFGKTNPAEAFTSGRATAFNSIAVEGDKIRVTVGANQAIDLKFVTGTPNTANREFNSLETLKTALNNVPGLTARISNNALYIAAKDGTSAVNFNNVGPGTTDFVAALGLTNIAASADKRFSTLGQLRTLLQANSDLTVTRAKSGAGLDISVKDPTQTVTFTAAAERLRPISYIEATQGDPAIAESARTLTSVKILSPNSGLIAGDFVRINGLTGNRIFNGGVAGGAHAVNGLFRVTSSDSGSFTISADAVINCGAVDRKIREAAPANATWQKVTGTEGAATDFTAAHTIASAVGNPAAVTFDLGAAPGVAVNDVLYIEGVGLDNGVIVPDGYYQVTAQVGNTFQISVPIASGANGAALMAGRGSFAKVGTSAAANAIQASLAFTNPAGSTVRVAMPDHGYSVDDYFRIGGAVLHDSVDNKTFKITATDTDWFEFQVDTAGDAAAFVALNGGALAVANYIDYFGKLDTNLGLRQDKDGTALDIVYNAGDSTKNLASGNIDGVWEQPLTVYDEQGNQHNLRIAFAKVGQNKWAVEIYSIADPNTGQFDVAGTNDGQIIASTITFNGDGSIASLGALGAPITINWTNGAKASSISINWGEVANGVTTSVFNNGGVKQLNGPNDVFFIDQDGYKPGRFTGITLDGTTGTWLANFDNGQTLAVFQMPICYVAAPNEMEPLGNGLFVPTSASGSILLKTSGADGVGTYIGGAIEGSNINNTTKTINLVDLKSQYGYLTSALASAREAEDRLLNKI